MGFMLSTRAWYTYECTALSLKTGFREGRKRNDALCVFEAQVTCCYFKVHWRTSVQGRPKPSGSVYYLLCFFPLTDKEVLLLQYPFCIPHIIM